MWRSALFLCTAFLAILPLSFAQEPGQRQYYSAWKKHGVKHYYYANYYFKKNANDPSYTYHYAIYFPSRGKRAYMYNPQSRRYWGYWEGNKYSILPEDKRKTSIDEIAAEDFPPLGAAPPVPGSSDKTAMIPPSRLPKLDENLP